MLPNLSRLGGGATTGTGLNDLPPELFGEILKQLDSEKPWLEIVRMCRYNRMWQQLCKTGILYDAANLAFGFYGALESWPEVVEFYALHEDYAGHLMPGATAPGPATAQQKYFEAVSQVRFKDQNSGILKFHPWYEAVLMRNVRLYQKPKLYATDSDLRGVDNYKEIALFYVERSPQNLMFVPTKRPDFGEIAEAAVKQNVFALNMVPKAHGEYGRLAKIAVQLNGMMLEGVPDDRDDYVEIAKLAVQQDGNALQYVPWERVSRADYGEIARLAVQQTVEALLYLPFGHADFVDLAQLSTPSE